MESPTSVASSAFAVEPYKLYKPFGSIPCSELGTPVVRLLLQGFGGTGKTSAALTFPNPVVLDIDNNLGGHRHRADVTVIPFWDESWATEYKKQYKIPALQKHELIFHWIKNEGKKLTEDQTLVGDSWTNLQNWFDTVVGAQKFYTAKGGEDGFQFWKLKKAFSLQVCEELKTLRCNQVWNCHETVERDDEGKITGKVKPLMQGAFSDELSTHFTDYYRQLVKENDKKEIQYLWQVRGDNKCNCKCTSIKLKPTDITFPANYSSFGFNKTN